MGKPQRKVKNLRKADQSRGINIKLRMEASVEADNDKTTNEGEQIDKWNWNLLLSQWLGQRLEAGWRSIDVVPLSYTDKRTELKMRALLTLLLLCWAHISCMMHTARHILLTPCSKC